MFTFVYNLLTRSAAVLLVAMLSVNYLPDTLFVDFPINPRSMESINYDAVIPQWNTLLSSSPSIEYIQLNNILGPESIAVAKNGLIYTGLADGRLVELDPAKQYKMRQVLRFKTSPMCKDNTNLYAAECGRPLQLRFQNDTLYMIEASTGLYKVDIKTGAKSFLGPKQLNPINLYNSFTFDPRYPDIVYITQSSTRWNLQRIFWSFLDLDNSGQIVALDIKTGKRVIIQDQLVLVNGIDADIVRDQLVFNELGKSRVHTINLDEARSTFINARDGQRKTTLQRSTLIETVPGMPDNVVIDKDIAYIALPMVKLNGKELIDHLSTMPNVRKAYCRFIYGAELILEYIQKNLYQHPLLDELYREMKSGHINYKLFQSGKSAVIEFNLATKTSRFLGSDKFGFLSEATPDSKGNLLLGSFRNSFLVKTKV